ncbi:threonine--tRNA ligase [archaeon]|nr:threonine--tRNA ligase [archaeon]
MKILLIHSDFIEYEPKKKAIESAEKLVKSKVRVEDCLVVFCSAEDGDSMDVVKPTIENIKDVANQVKADRIVVYPFVHLCSKPASPSVALQIVKAIEEGLKDSYEVYRAPFGWYKEFTLKCKGHPLSELSREIAAGKEKDVSEAVKKEPELKSEFFIIEPSGAEHKIEIRDGKVIGFDFSKYEKLGKLVNYEMAKSHIVDKEPPHIGIMKRLELVNYEDASDPGNFRYMPKGRLIKSLLEDFVTRETIKHGAMEVETPIMYDYEHPALKSYLNRFPSRQYTIQTPNKKVFLRFSACFGQFLMAHDSNISYRNLPLSMYELTKYSFRVEQRGEIAGLRRLRTFTMPDCHALCKDITQAKDEMQRRFELARTVVEGSGLSISDDMEFAIRVVRDFYEENKDFVHAIIRKWGKPAFVEIWDKKFFYFIFKYEWNFVDALDKAATLTTDQIDVENAERYDIRFIDSDNKKKFPVILHLSPSGAIERVMYGLLEKAYMQQQAGKNPTLPMWLSPTQIRLCPVNDSFIPFAENISEQLEKENIRSDIDDRTESIGKKIRDAEMEWVPIIVVLGEKERDSGQLPARFRETGKVENMAIKDLVRSVTDKTKNFPYKQLSLPKLLTKRPVFN